MSGIEPDPRVKKPWYQNPVTMSFFAFVLILIAGTALGISLITRGSNSNTPSNSDSAHSFCKNSDESN